MTRRIIALVAGSAAIGLTYAHRSAEQVQTPVAAADAKALRNARPFLVGERATYEIKYLFFPPGTGTLEVAGIDTIRGHDAYRFLFTIRAGAFGYNLRDTMQSWVDTANFQGLRFNQDQHEGGKDRQRRYELFPERVSYSDRGKPEQPSVSDPLDDLSFLYFVRGIDLQVGKHEEFARYFKPESNPVKLSVLKKETITVPFGTFKTVLVQPIIKAGGLFGEKGEARVWITDDSARVIVQVKIDMPVVGTLTLRLKSYQASPQAPRAP